MRTTGSNKAYIMVCCYLISISCLGCSSVGYLASETQQFNGKDSMLLKTPRSDILDIIAEAGKSMGYYVSALDKAQNTISLSSSISMPTMFLIGKHSQVMLTISVKDEGKKLDIDAFVHGNFGTGGQEEATRLVNDFKAKLIDRINRQ